MIPNGATFDGDMHTWADFRLIPKSKLTFDPSAPRYILEELPGASGEIDHSDILTGSVAYDDREGKFAFLAFNETGYLIQYKAIKAYFNGSVRKCVLDDDPEHEYRGRFYLSSWKSHEDVSECEITYVAEPFRYSVETITKPDWLWDDMEFASDDYLYFAYFSVELQKARTLVNEGTIAVAPTIICTAPMSVEMDGATFYFQTGSSTNPIFRLSPGRNLCTFYGNGTVRVAYPREVVP